MTALQQAIGDPGHLKGRNVNLQIAEWLKEGKK
jgi:hypothetical protein